MDSKYYADIFAHSGPSYHRAMQEFPCARDEEFNAVIEFLNLTKGTNILDIPSGGGYLKRYLPSHITYNALDFSDGFADSKTIRKCSETDFGIPLNSIDIAICLAGLHHIEDKPGFFKAAIKTLKNNGLFIIGDVISDSKEAIFLNEFVDKWNPLGHKGTFIKPIALEKSLIETGFNTNYSRKDFHWNFETREQARHYVRLLFNLDKNPTNEELDDALQMLGCQSTDTGFQLNWSLGFFQATKGQ